MNNYYRHLKLRLHVEALLIEYVLLEAKGSFTAESYFESVNTAILDEKVVLANYIQVTKPLNETAYIDLFKWDLRYNSKIDVSFF